MGTMGRQDLRVAAGKAQLSRRSFGVLCIILSTAMLLGAIPAAWARGGSPTPGTSYIVDAAQLVPFAPVQHVITIVMENEEYPNVVGNPSAPYENALAANYTLLTSYYAVDHPSLPNYLAIVSGTTYVSSDCLPSQCSTNSSSIVNLLQSKGLTWKEYAESMPTNCSQTISPDGLYQPKHDPFVYFSSITGNNGTGQTSAYCDSHVVSFTQFWADLSANALPSYSFITPNMCDDGHDCGISTADAWLSTVVPRIESSQDFNSTVLFIVYDEGSTSAGFGDIHGGQVLCIVVSPLVNRGYQSTVQYSHYSLLATTESLLWLGSLGRNDSTAQPMNDIFAACRTQGGEATGGPCQPATTTSALSSTSSSSASSSMLGTTSGGSTASLTPSTTSTLSNTSSNSSVGAGTNQPPTNSDLYIVYSLAGGLGIATILLLATGR
jgi:phosphatidylinositol-3-phosphatase